MLFGASVVSFIASVCHWRNLNPRRKKMNDSSPTVRNILTISDIAMLGCMLVYVYYLYITSDMLQVLGVFVGILLQAMINRTVSYQQKNSHLTQASVVDNAAATAPSGRRDGGIIITSSTDHP